MILDLTLKGKSYFLKIHKNFFKNKSTPLTLFQNVTPLMEKYSYLGVFHVGGPKFGFDGCFERCGEENDYVRYRFDFPKTANDGSMRKMLLTVYLATYYVVEQMYYEKEFFSETIWNDQSLSFVIFNGGEITGGYEIGGQIYPWFKNKLSLLNSEQLICLNEYVKTELNRINNYFRKEDLSYSQITILNNSFFIIVDKQARWIHWLKKCDEDKQEEFDSHNTDFQSDQELCFAAVIAINTWLREN